MNNSKKDVEGVGDRSKAVTKALAQLEESGLEVINVDEYTQPEIIDIGQPEPYVLTALETPTLLDPMPKKDRGRVVEPVRSTLKVQRNEPCPCGSGKKFKKCCQ